MRTHSVLRLCFTAASAEQIRRKDDKATQAREDAARVPVLDGVRVLVVEDSGLVAFKITQILRKGGCSLVGPTATLAMGLVLVKREGSTLDAAVLDIDLRGEPVYPPARSRPPGAPGPGGRGRAFPSVRPLRDSRGSAWPGSGLSKTLNR